MELLRRVLLGLATALIVIRALVPGEDVGLLEPGTSPLGLVVPLLWLVGLAAWTAWRILARQLDWYGGLIEAALLVVVLFAFVGTLLAPAWQSYQHPAWIVSWEWAGLLAAFFLVRQIARSPADQRGLLAALLATGVSLAGQSIYQHAVPDRGHAPLPGLTADELPRIRCEALALAGQAPQNAFPASLSLPSLVAATSDPTLFERVGLRNNVRPESGEPALPVLLRPTPAQPPAATFTTTANLAAFLALLLPALVGCVLAAWLGGAPRWQLGVAIAFALLVALALWLTEVRSAIVPCLLVGAVASVLAWRYASARPANAAGPSRRLLLLALAGPAVLLVLAFVLRPSGGEGLDDLTREWSAAWAMIRDHFWLGVGPGNYGRHYPQYMAPTAPAFARQPDNFALEVWATLGLPALLALGAALVIFFRRTLSVIPAEQQATRDEEPGTAWEFYEGGMIGLLLGFLFRAQSMGPDAILTEALTTSVRAVVWFAAFALIHGIRWTGATRVLACTAGVAVLLLHLAVSGGFFVPGIAQPLWIMAALALNGLPERPVPFGRQVVGRVVPLALATAAALMCLLQVVVPMLTGAADNASALATAQRYLDVGSRVYPEGKPERLERPGDTQGRIVKGLVKAADDDPNNARYHVDAANWCAELFDASPSDTRYYDAARRFAWVAQLLDPRGEAGYLAEARLYQIATRRAPKADLRKQAAIDSPEPLQKILSYRPNDAQLHYFLAVVLFGSGEPNRGREEAKLALKLDLPDLPPGRRLSDAQRQQAERFATQRRPLP
jgi:O-Antigen ligase